MINQKLRNTFLLSVTAAAVGFAGCADPTTIDDHFEVEGFAIYEGTTEIYRFMVDGTTMPTGGPILTQGVHDVAFVLLDHDGQPIEDDDHDEADHDEHELQITIEDTSILTWTPEADDGGDAHTFVEFHGELNALQEGSTTMAVCVPHGLHCDLEAEVPVSVTAP